MFSKELRCLADCSFVYRTHFSNIFEVCMNYFVSKELDIAYALGRHFFWYKNILFVDDILSPAPPPEESSGVRMTLPAKRTGPRVTVVLSEYDAIVPSVAVRKYLVNSGLFQETSNTEMSEINQDPSVSTTLPTRQQRARLFWLKGHFHGEMLFQRQTLRKFQKALRIVFNEAVI